DGTVIELNKDAIFDRTVVRVSGLKVKARSFALPGLEPGVVVEYGWKERHEEQLADYIELQLQREYPVKIVRCHLKPLQSPYFPYAMRTLTFNLPSWDGDYVQEPRGFYGVSFSNISAYREEPYMPPEHEVRGSMLVYYSKDDKLSPDKYWSHWGRLIY